MTVEQSSVRNILLRLCPPATFDRLAARLEPLPMPRGTLLYAPNTPFEHVYFPEAGLGSVITISPEGHRIEAGMFGFDGLVPWGVPLEADRSPNQVDQQVPGHGFRVPVGLVRELMNDDPQFRSVLLRFAQASTIQTSYTALSNAIHQVDERLARWLLMAHDRTDGDEIALTHDYLSLMLAVRRPSVTTALHVLEGNGFIRAERGVITIRNRGALEEFAGDAYGKPEEEYERLLAPLRCHDPRDAVFRHSLTEA